MHDPKTGSLRWMLPTTSPVDALERVLDVAFEYRCRWRIEELHRAWQRGGGNVEGTQLRRREAVQKWAAMHDAVTARRRGRAARAFLPGAKKARVDSAPIMAVREFFDDAARARVKHGVANVEALTSAEVVVAVRRRTGQYRDVDLAAGAVVALATLLVLIFADTEFSTPYIPLDVAVAFGVGALLSSQIPWLRRALVSRARRRASARAAGCEAFFKMGIGKTSGRTGILVLVALYEREIAVIEDVGVDRKALGAAYEQAVLALERSISRASPKLDQFAAALEALGPALAPALPRQEDDINELPDDAEVA
ncbi:MAG: hypothetical protein OZ921_02775 [Sorangiineae bacterium]|nr:hypothetical protein [Sorangiineae bacterium]